MMSVPPGSEALQEAQWLVRPCVSRRGDCTDGGKCEGTNQRAMNDHGNLGSLGEAMGRAKEEIDEVRDISFLLWYK